MRKQLFFPPLLLPSLWGVVLIKEGTASKHAKGSHSNKGQIGVYKKSIICFECCRAPKLPSTQQAFMRLQYVFTISVGLYAVLDWFLIVATIVMMWSATVPCWTYICHIQLRFSWPQSQINNNKTLVLWASRVSWVLQEKTSSCSNDSWCPKIWKSDTCRLDVRNTMLVTLE